MFFFLSRLFNVVMSPASWFFILLIATIWVNNKNIRKRIVWVAAVLFLVLTSGPLYCVCERAWCRDNLDQVDTTKHYDFAFIPGGFAGIDTTRATIDYGEPADRLIDAVKLHNMGVVDRIIISSDASCNDTLLLPYFYDEMQRSFGLDSTTFLIEMKAPNTIDNFRMTLDLYGPELEGKSVLVINSAIVMPRTKLCAEKLGLNWDFHAVDVPAINFDFTIWNSYMPAPEIMEEWRRLLHEWIGYLTYLIFF